MHIYLPCRQNYCSPKATIPSPTAILGEQIRKQCCSSLPKLNSCYFLKLLLGHNTRYCERIIGVLLKLLLASQLYEQHRATCNAVNQHSQLYEQHRATCNAVNQHLGSILTRLCISPYINSFFNEKKISLWGTLSITVYSTKKKIIYLAR